MKSLRTLAVLVCLALVSVSVGSGTAQAATNQVGTYVPVATARLLDTRHLPPNNTHTPLGPAGRRDLSVAGKSGVPASGVAAVVVNLTVVGATAGNYLTVWPAGQTRPVVSSINFKTGETRANIATVKLGASGALSIYNASGSVDVIVDLVGYYSSAATTDVAGNDYANLTPERQLDTRQDAEGQLTSGHVVDIFNDFGFEGALTENVNALAVNITAVNAQGSGYLTAWDGVGAPPATSSLNYVKTTAVPNMAVIKTSLCTDPNECNQSPHPPTRISIYNGGRGPVDVLVDLVGLYFNDGTTGLRFVPLTTPLRIKDSRTPAPGTALTAGQTRLVTAPSTAAGADTVSLVTNVTAVRPSTSTYLTLWAADGSSRPTTSNVNAPAQSAVANGAVVDLSSSRGFNIFNSSGTTNYLVDVAGRFDVGTATTARAEANGSTERGVTGTQTGRRSLPAR